MPQNQNQKPLILWDVGGVLLELNYTKFYQEGAKVSGIPSEDFKQIYTESKLELDTLNGTLSNEDYQTQLKQLLGNPNLSRTELESVVQNCWGGEITPVVDLKQRVYFEAECPVGIFSNINQFAFEYLSRTHPRMFQTFNPEAPMICSHISKAVKPHPPMYEEAQQYAKENSINQIILIEDRKKYLAKGIQDFGWKGIWFTPYIDSAEAIRQTQDSDNLQLPKEKFRQADNIQELEQALREFEVAI